MRQKKAFTSSDLIVRFVAPAFWGFYYVSVVIQRTFLKKELLSGVSELKLELEELPE